MNEILYFNTQYLGYLWLIVSVICLLAEITTPGLFFFIAFAIGALKAAVLAFLGYSLVIQCLGCVAAALVSFLFLRYFFAVKNRGKNIKTNVDALVGKTGTVVKTIEPTVFGQVKVEGEVWAAESLDGKTISKGTVVRIEGVIGNRVKVKA